jgi:hypothetical protein
MAHMRLLIFNLLIESWSYRNLVISIEFLGWFYLILTKLMSYIFYLNILRM